MPYNFEILFSSIRPSGEDFWTMWKRTPNNPEIGHNEAKFCLNSEKENSAKIWLVNAEAFNQFDYGRIFLLYYKGAL